MEVEGEVQKTVVLKCQSQAGLEGGAAGGKAGELAESCRGGQARKRAVRQGLKCR